MPVTDSTVLDDAQQTGFVDQFILAQAGKFVWDQFTTPDFEIMSRQKGNPGKTFSIPVLERLAPQPTALPEDSDVVASTFSDALASVTLSEYGDSVDMSRFLRETGFYNIDKAAAKALAENMAETKELIARYAYMSGTRIWYPGGAAAMTTLDGTNSDYRLTFKNLQRLRLYAEALELPKWPDGSYVTVVPPCAEFDLMDDNLWENLGVYCDPTMIWDGTPGSETSGGKFQNEVGRLAGIRICTSTFGKVCYSGGATAQAATTLSAAAAAGATSVTVTSATGLAVGDHITIGTLATAGSEQVEITSIASTPTLSIEGVGNTRNNTGLKYAHLSGAAVTEASQVAELPIITPNSVLKVWHEYTDQDGRITIKEKEGLNVAGRFFSYSWLGWWGYSVAQENWLLRGQFAVPEKHPGYYRELV